MLYLCGETTASTQSSGILSLQLVAGGGLFYLGCGCFKEELQCEKKTLIKIVN